MQTSAKLQKAHAQNARLCNTFSTCHFSIQRRGKFYASNNIGLAMLD